MDNKESLKILLEELIRYRNIFLQDKEEQFKNERFLTTIDCHIEDLSIELEEE